MPPEVLLLYRIVLAILGFLIFHMMLSTVLSRSMKNFAGILMGIALNLQIAFGKNAIFTMLIMPVQEHGRFFYFLLQITLISFIKDLKVLSTSITLVLLEVLQDILCYWWRL